MYFKKIKPPYIVEPLQTKALTNDTFLLNKQYFIKQTKNFQQPFLNLNNQVNVVKLIQWEKFTLPILEIQLTNNQLTTLMKYYHHLINFSEEIIYQEILIDIAILVQQLHQFEKNNNDIITWNAIEQLNLYCSLNAPQQNLEPIKREIIVWLNTYQPKKLVLCHNDLSANNFVSNNNRWYLIDWDFACWNDPLFDVASFASETLKMPNDIDIWFECFKLNDTEIKIVQKWMVYQNFIWYHWSNYLYEKTKQVIYLEIKNEKLKKLVDN